MHEWLLGGLCDFCDICVIFASIVFDMSRSFKPRWCTASIRDDTGGIQKTQKCSTCQPKIWHRQEHHRSHRHHCRNEYCRPGENATLWWWRHPCRVFQKVQNCTQRRWGAIAKNKGHEEDNWPAAHCTKVHQISWLSLGFWFKQFGLSSDFI